MKENCVNLEIVLANGKVIETAGHGARPRWNRAAFPSQDFASPGKHLQDLTSLNCFLEVRELLG